MIQEIIKYLPAVLVVLAGIYYNWQWHKASKEDGISKEEVINNAFGNVFFILIINLLSGGVVDWDVLSVVVIGMGATHLIDAWKKKG